MTPNLVTHNNIWIKHKTLITRIVLVVAFITIFFTSLFVGIANISLKDFFTFEKEAWFYIFYTRFPRTMSVTLVAASLCVGGLVMQTIGGNKLISPSTIGATQAAKLGVLITFLFGVLFKDNFGKISFAFAFSMSFTLFFMFVLSKIKFKNSIYVPLLGILFGALLEAVAIFLAEFTGLTQQLQNIGFGNFTMMTSGRYEYVYILLVPLAIGIACATTFSIVGMGEDFSKSVGVSHKFYVCLGVFTVAVISAITFVLVGTLTFLGLVIPNLAAQFFGDNTKRSIWEVILLGAIFLLICDIFSRIIIYPYELSINLIVSIIGGIMFLIILFAKRRGVR